MALNKIILKHVSDDTFLYFRCRLILEGIEIFKIVLEKPDSFADINFKEAFSGETLLSVADNAILKLYGNHFNEELPTDKHFNYFNYNFFDDEIIGEDWQEEDLPIRFQKLWKKYN